MTNLDFVEPTTERLLGILRRRDDEALDKLTTQIAELAREKRVALSSSESQLQPMSYQLGAVEALESLAVRAAARAPMNARFEVMRRRHALDLLQVLAEAPRHGRTATYLAEALNLQRPNISRLLEAMIAVDVVCRAQTPSDASTVDARASPVEITQAGMHMLEGLRPNWRMLARALEIPAEQRNETQAYVMSNRRSYEHSPFPLSGGRFRVKMNVVTTLGCEKALGQRAFSDGAVKFSKKNCVYGKRSMYLSAPGRLMLGSTAHVTTKARS